MPLIVVVDANVLRASPNLELNPWKSLLDRREEWDLELIVPEVALHEAVHLLHVGWEQELEKVQALNIGNLLDLDGQKQELADMLRAKIDQLEEWFRDRCEELGVRVVAPPDGIDWMDIAKRAIYRQPPYNEYSEKSKPKDGFRDTLIWHTLLAVAAEDTDAEVWFVSKNHTDFGAPGLETRELNSWSVPFHPVLASELEALGLSDRVRYVTNMPRLVSNLSARFEPIGEGKFQDLLAQLDKDGLIEALRDRLINLPLDPRTAALDLNVKVGRVATATDPEWEDWHFEEHAWTIQPGGWRARFEVDTQVDVDTTELAGEGTMRDKWLRFSGDLTVLPDGNVAQLVVTTAEALPDDPMRARWKRADAQSRAVGAARDWALSSLDGPAWRETVSNLLTTMNPVWQAHPEASGIGQAMQSIYGKVDISEFTPMINVGTAYSGIGLDTAFANVGTSMIGLDPSARLGSAYRAAMERDAQPDREEPSAPRRPVPAQRQPEPSSESPRKPKKTSENKDAAQKATAKKAAAKKAAAKKAAAKGATKKTANKPAGPEKSAGGKSSTTKKAKP
ncbi:MULTISPECIES: PIN domain-containing protein [Actinomycetes]|uniref:PIN domain-containing protein n=1 Tax=Nocardia testacea TaxID=248551 RepID=A0ABW7W6Y8_9NOCA